MILREPPPVARSNMVRISIIGEGPEAERWAHALAHAGDVRLLRSGAPGEPWARCGDIAAFLEQPAAEAVVLADPLADAYGLARRALQAGKHVLCAGPFLLGTRQTAMLASLARQLNLVLVFHEEAAYHPAFAFLARMVGASDPFWPPLYIRSLRAALPEAASSGQVDALAATEIAMILRLVGEPPQTVAATGPRRGGGGPLEAAFLTLSYAGGLTALLIVSVAEASPAAELTVVTQGRTLRLDENDLRAPLRTARAGHVPGSSREMRSKPCGEDTGEHSLPQTGPADPLEEQARAFVEAVASGDTSIGNASLWCQVALVWETARESVTLGGAPVALPPWASGSEYEKAPPLKVIEGGAQSGAAVLQRPALTLVTS